ncbi:GGDEF domain-containing protein [Candidatus Woesebacteria bacterium]|nr:GGDEF domain-containing protein [Candidatus Woesebacteria bacterium]
MIDRLDQAPETNKNSVEGTNTREEELKAENADLKARIAELEKILETDELTGLYNRKGFEKNAERYHMHAMRTQEPYAIAYIDLNKFKDVNDLLGHKAGDEILVLVAMAINETIRAEDLAARLHGDEFGILLENFKLENGDELVGRVDEAIQKGLTLKYPGATKEDMIKRNVNVTIGVYLWNGEKDWDQVLVAADNAMNVKKEHGVR